MPIEPPEDEASIGYNYFDGGGITVHGPAMIVRKEVQGKTAIEAGARVDLVSSASIDVLTQGSKFRETRKEYTFGASRIFDETLLFSNYTLSDESDYTSNTLCLGLAHDLFEKNLTLTLSVSRAWDEVGDNSDPAFGEKGFNRSTYSLGLAQSFSPRLLAQFNYEVTADEGYINSPYRNVLVGATLSASTFEPEVYPDARTGQAFVIRSSYGFLSNTAGAGIGSTVQLSYRYYKDTFDVRSHTGKLFYQRHLSGHWLLGLFYQYHSQEAASFYSDFFQKRLDFMARDKELSTFSDHWLGASIKFKPTQKKWGKLANPYFKVGYSFILFDYDNFSDPRNQQLYSWEAHVFQTTVGFNY